ncbi:hypothetical protein KIN20_030308 [Parelaphostrongylus tenuis]|uniref:Uncharacterized protein n=1 Tax=Parelaphostrongylus tenuis TaxID=148309 RepID=A0AAD5R3V5_PARTN|nr:hypothetical protein KIN20_030308 [Parelaphostrongylus tenuis]
MVFTTSASAPAQLPGGIATTSDAAKSFLSRFVMQTITYDPLECKAVTVNPAAELHQEVYSNADRANEDSIFLDSHIDVTHVSATMIYEHPFKTTNIVMANWSREMLAKFTEQSSADVGIGSVCRTLLSSTRKRCLKRELNHELPEIKAPYLLNDSGGRRCVYSMSKLSKSICMTESTNQNHMGMN